MVSPSDDAWCPTSFVVNKVKLDSRTAIAALGSSGTSAHVDPGLRNRWLQRKKKKTYVGV